MLHIRFVTQENIEAILHNYNLPEQCSGEVQSPLSLAKYVFDTCAKFIPRRLRDHLTVSQAILPIVKNDLCLHIIINAFMAKLYLSNENVKNNGALFTVVADLLTQSVANNDNVMDLFGDHDVVRIAKEQFATIGNYLNLPSEGNNKGYHIPSFLAPYIGYLSTNYNIHKLLKNYKESTFHTNSFVRKNRDLSDKIHLHYYDNFSFLLNSFNNIKIGERLFKEKKYDHYPALNKIIFEKEYHLGLASKITVMTNAYPLEIRLQYQKLLCLASLLPNINGRLY